MVESEESQLRWKSDFQNLYLISLKASKTNVEIMSDALAKFVKILLKLDAKNLISLIEPSGSSENIKTKCANKQLNLSQLNFLGTEKTIQ